jgi:hypothetical protein
VFAKHGANLSMLKQMVQRVLYPAAADIHLTDGFPISVCMNGRGRTIFKSEDEVSWGFAPASRSLISAVTAMSFCAMRSSPSH